MAKKCHVKEMRVQKGFGRKGIDRMREVKGKEMTENYSKKKEDVKDEGERDIRRTKTKGRERRVVAFG